VRAVLFPTRRRIIRCVVRGSDRALNKLGQPNEDSAAEIKTALEEASADATWPVSFFDGGSKLQPTVGMVHASDVPPVTRVLLGNWDGYLRFYDDSVSSDDGEPFSNHVVYGPMLLGKSGAHEGMITELIGVPAEGSGDVDWELKVGKTIERAKNATAFTSGTWREGINRTIRTRARGYAWYLKLKGKGGAPWAMERITAGLQTSGRQQYA